MIRLRRRLSLSFTAGAAAAVLGLPGCALLGPPRRITFTADEISRRIDREFPLERRLLDIFDVTLLVPTITLLPDRGRVAAVLDLQARERVLGNRWQGRLQFDAALRWEPADRTLRMVQVRVRDLALRDPRSADRSTAERLVAAVTERMLEAAVLYRMPADVAARLQRQGVMPGSVSVTGRGVEIALVPFVPAAPAPSASGA